MIVLRSLLVFRMEMIPSCLPEFGCRSDLITVLENAWLDGKLWGLHDDGLIHDQLTPRGTRMQP